MSIINKSGTVFSHDSVSSIAFSAVVEENSNRNSSRITRSELHVGLIVSAPESIVVKSKIWLMMLKRCLPLFRIMSTVCCCLADKPSSRSASANPMMAVKGVLIS